jgi:glutamyl-tRNA reductase
MPPRTAAALASLDELLASLKRLPSRGDLDQVVSDAEALRRAVAAFHMEAIRFRMYSVDRDLKSLGDDPAIRQLYEKVRQTLEEAGFHTRSHTAP